MRHLDYTTEKGNWYRIEYRLVGFLKWEWDILLYSPDPSGDWLGLTFNWERTLFPKRRMESILRCYSEYKDGASERSH